MHLVFDPLLHDRVAIAHAAKAETKFDVGSLVGIAIWASVSEEVDTSIREQVKAGVFPVRLKSDDWTSGKINWLLDLVAPSPQLATAVIANFKQVVKGGELRIHPLVSSLLDGETLRKMGVAAGRGEVARKKPEQGRGPLQFYYLRIGESLIILDQSVYSAGLPQCTARKLKAGTED